jgi:hypothetical protein
MITLFASIAGFISSIIPEFVRFFKDKSDKQHQLELLEKQMQISQLTFEKQVKDFQDTKDRSETEMLYSTFNVGVGWVDALNGTVRPVMAYSFFILYAVIKYVQYSTLMITAQVPEIISMIWSADDQAIFAGIISFYFGQRTFSKMWKKN